MKSLLQDIEDNLWQLQLYKLRFGVISHKRAVINLHNLQEVFYTINTDYSTVPTEVYLEVNTHEMKDSLHYLVA
jgi:hypothetical protein